MTLSLSILSILNNNNNIENNKLTWKQTIQFFRQLFYVWLDVGEKASNF